MIFTVPGKPQGKARARTFYNPRLGRSQSITPEKTVLYENFIKSCYEAADIKCRWFDKEPLQMEINAYFDIPKSASKKQREEMIKGERTPTKKPDADNIAKVICDALNGVAYKDDTQIVSLHIRKIYAADEPRVTVSICQLNGKEKSE